MMAEEEGLSLLRQLGIAAVVVVVATGIGWTVLDDDDSVASGIPEVWTPELSERAEAGFRNVCSEWAYDILDRGGDWGSAPRRITPLGYRALMDISRGCACMIRALMEENSPARLAETWHRSDFMDEELPRYFKQCEDRFLE